VSAASPQVPRKCKNTDWKLEDDPKFGDTILHSLMRIRTDFNQFTVTEIYALGYCGYSTAVFVLLHAGLIKQEVVGDREALETQFANIMNGLLKPLPPDRWEKRLAFADSRFWARRTLGRVFSGVLQRNCSFQSASICRALAPFGERACLKLCPLLYTPAIFFELIWEHLRSSSSNGFTYERALKSK
jgi:hypothetical protein